MQLSGQCTSVSSVTKNLVMNTNKFKSAFSDFPVPDDCPFFMPNHVAEEYLNNYADHFKLKECIKFGHELIDLKELDDGTWSLRMRANYGQEFEQSKFSTVFFSAMDISPFQKCLN